MVKSNKKILFIGLIFFNFNLSFGQLPKGVKIPVREDNLGESISPDQAWPDSLTKIESDYNMIMSWRDFFTPTKPHLIVIESIPDSLNYNWFKPRAYVDEDGGGEPFSAIPEFALIKQYKRKSKTPKKWDHFIKSTHKYWKSYYQHYLSENYNSLNTKQINNICDSIDYNYYEISPIDYRKYKDRDHYDMLKYYIYNELSYYANTVQNSLDSILFSKRYGYLDAEKIPPSLFNFINQEFSKEKEKLIVDGDSTYYKKIARFKISFKPKSNYPLWFSNSVADSTIYISPVVLRSLITLSLIKYTNNLDDDYFSYIERFVYYDFTYKKRINNNLEYSYVNRKTNTLANIYRFNSSFFEKFAETLSFIFQHEMSHVYLQKNDVSEQNELKCDCYALLMLADKNYEPPGEYVAGFVKPGVKYGIFNTLLKSSILNNKPELWNVRDTEKLKIRFKFLQITDPSTLSKNICDSLK